MFEFECFNSLMSPGMCKLIRNACNKIISAPSDFNDTHDNDKQVKFPIVISQLKRLTRGNKRL